MGPTLIPFCKYEVLSKLQCAPYIFLTNPQPNKYPHGERGRLPISGGGGMVVNKACHWTIKTFQNHILWPVLHRVLLLLAPEVLVVSLLSGDHVRHGPRLPILMDSASSQIVVFVRLFQSGFGVLVHPSGQPHDSPSNGWKTPYPSIVDWVWFNRSLF